MLGTVKEHTYSTWQCIVKFLALCLLKGIKKPAGFFVQGVESDKESWREEGVGGENTAQWWRQYLEVARETISVLEMIWLLHKIYANCRK